MDARRTNDFNWNFHRLTQKYAESFLLKDLFIKKTRITERNSPVLGVKTGYTSIETPPENAA